MSKTIQDYMILKSTNLEDMQKQIKNLVSPPRRHWELVGPAQVVQEKTEIDGKLTISYIFFQTLVLRD